MIKEKKTIRLAFPMKIADPERINQLCDADHNKKLTQEEKRTKLTRNDYIILKTQNSPTPNLFLEPHFIRQHYDNM